MVVTRGTKQKQTRLEYYQPVTNTASRTTDDDESKTDDDHKPSRKRRKVRGDEQSIVESSSIFTVSDDERDEVVFTCSRTRRHSRRAVVLSDDESVGSISANQGYRRGRHDSTLAPSDPESHYREVEGEDDDDDIKLPIQIRRKARRLEPTSESIDDLTERQQLADDLNDLEDNSLQETRTRPVGISHRRATQNDQLRSLRARREAKQRGEDLQLPNAPDSGSVMEDLYDPFLCSQEENDFLTDDNDVDESTDSLKQTLPGFTITSTEEAFETVVDFLVRKHLHTDSRFNAERYEFALRKVDNQASTYAGSKFSSSAWRPDFYRVLNARPKLEDQSLGLFPVDGCQACGRSTHPATWRLRFAGLAYDRKTLDELQDDYDESGNPIFSEGCEFSVGNECRKNAVYAHSFRHWQFHLSTQVRDYLMTEGYLPAEEDAVLDRLHDSDRLAWAEAALEAMKADQSMDGLFTRLRDAMEHANSRLSGSGRQALDD